MVMNVSEAPSGTDNGTTPTGHNKKDAAQPEAVDPPAPTPVSKKRLLQKTQYEDLGDVGPPVKKTALNLAKTDRYRSSLGALTTLYSLGTLFDIMAGILTAQRPPRLWPGPEPHSTST